MQGMSSAVFVALSGRVLPVNSDSNLSKWELKLRLNSLTEADDTSVMGKMRSFMARTVHHGIWDTAARNVWPVAFTNKEQAAEILQQMMCSLDVGKVYLQSAHKVCEVLMMMAVDGSLRNVRPLLRQIDWCRDVGLTACHGFSGVSLPKQHFENIQDWEIEQNLESRFCRAEQILGHACLDALACQAWTSINAVIASSQRPHNSLVCRSTNKYRGIDKIIHLKTQSSWISRQSTTSAKLGFDRSLATPQ